MEEPFFNEFLVELETRLQCLFTKGADISIPSFPWSEVQICVADFDNASDVQLKCLCAIPRGRYLVALGRSWHPEEFTCSQCKAVLDEGGFFEERGSVYCTKCHDNRYAPNCAKCKKKITGVRAALLR